MSYWNFTNPYVDYSYDTSALYLSGDKLNQEILLKIQAKELKLSKEIEKVLPVFQANGDYSIYTGYCGIAFLYFKKYRRTKSKFFLEKALYLVNNALENLKNKRVSFLNGDAGPLALGAVLHKFMDDDKRADELIDKLVHLLDGKGKDVPEEVLYGHAGYLYALIFVDKHIGPVVPVEKLRQVIEIIIKSGIKRSKALKSSVPLEYSWHNKNYLGAAHGVSGILYILLLVEHALSDFEKNDLIQPTLEWLAKQRFPSKNFMSSQGSDRDRLVQWCHGAPGFVQLFLLASQVFKKTSFFYIAVECTKVIWTRGLLNKGYSICHGVSGNAYAFLATYAHTKQPEYLFMAAAFADWCTSHPLKEGMKPDRPYSLYEGIAGVDYFLFDIQDPLNSGFPAFDLT